MSTPGYRYRVETDDPDGIETRYYGSSLDDALAAFRQSVEAEIEYVTLEAIVAVTGPPPPQDVQVAGGLL